MSYTAAQGQAVLNEFGGDVNAISQAYNIPVEEINAFIAANQLSYTPQFVDLNDTGFNSAFDVPGPLQNQIVVNDDFVGSDTVLGTFDGNLIDQGLSGSNSGIPTYNPVEPDTEGMYEGAATQLDMLGNELNTIANSGMDGANQIRSAAELISGMGLSGHAIAQATDYSVSEVERMLASQGFDMSGNAFGPSMPPPSITPTQAEGIKGILQEVGQNVIDGVVNVGDAIAQIISLGKAPELEMVIPNIWDMISKGQVGGQIVWGGGNATPTIIGTSTSGTPVGVNNPIIGSIINAGKDMILNGASIVDVIKKLPEDLKPQAGAIIGGVIKSGALNVDEVKENEETLVGLGVEESVIKEAYEDYEVPTGNDTVNVIDSPTPKTVENQLPDETGVGIIYPGENVVVRGDDAIVTGTTNIDPGDPVFPGGDGGTTQPPEDGGEDKGEEPPPSETPEPTSPPPSGGGAGLGGLLGMAGGIEGIFSPYIPKWQKTKITPVKRLFKP